MIYNLPKSLEVGGVEHEIRTDYRVILDAISALNDPDLYPIEKAEACVRIIFPDWEKIGNHGEAYEKAMWFIACGETDNSGKKKPKVMDWEQDFSLIVSPVNRILGYDCRGVEYLHWWSFIAAYYEIGECAFSCVTGIRQKLAKGKPLDKWEKTYYAEHSDTIKLKARVSSDEQAMIDDILGGDDFG